MISDSAAKGARLTENIMNPTSRFINILVLEDVVNLERRKLAFIFFFRLDTTKWHVHELCGRRGSESMTNLHDPLI